MSDTDSLDLTARSAAKAYMGAFAWPTVVLGGVLAVLYLATLAGVAGGHLSVPVALPLIILITYGSYTVFHEAVHGSINGSNASLRWVNELMGYLAGAILMIPLTAHRHEHMAHHRNTNQPEADPDYVVAQVTRSPLGILRANMRMLANQYSYYFKHRWQAAPRSQNLRFCLEIAVAITLRLAFMAQGLWVEGILLFLVGGIGGFVLLMYLFAYVVHRPHTAVGRYADTSTVLLDGPWGKVMTVLWGYQNYHSIHHLFPRVPFYNYPKLYREIEDTMIARGAPIYQLSFRGLKPRMGLAVAAI